MSFFTLFLVQIWGKHIGRHDILTKTLSVNETTNSWGKLGVSGLYYA